jgi:hypothetical protein
MACEASWLTIANAFGTLAIAGLGISIALAQWYTARWKLALDLFEHRRAVYTDILKCVGQVIREPRDAGGVLSEYARAADRAEFLFGSDVTMYVARLRQTLNNLAVSHSMSDDRAPSDQRQAMAQLHLDSMRELAEAYGTLIGLMGPYMKLDQKQPWTLDQVWTFLVCKARQLWLRLRDFKFR